MAAVAVLTAVAILVAGGLIAGIVASTASSGQFGSSRTMAGLAITWGSQWAVPLLAAVLLGVIGLCWWQVEAWNEATSDDPERRSDASGHIRRMSQIIRWTQAALALTVVGAIAALAGNILDSGLVNNPLNWARYVYLGASLVAVVVIAGAGVWVGRLVADRTVHAA
jgi:hypothetical protein